ALKNGDFSARLPRGQEGAAAQIAETVNALADQLAAYTSEVTRIHREIGVEGKLGGQAQMAGAAGAWKDLADSVNSMAYNLTAQVRDITSITTSVANGDLTRKITVEARGEILELKVTINTMMDQLGA